MKIDGKKMRDARKAAGFRSRNALAEAAGVSAYLIEQMERFGHQIDYPAETIAAIAVSVGCRPEDIERRPGLFSEHDEQPPKKGKRAIVTVPRDATDDEIVKVAHAFRGSGVLVYFE